jgi:type IV secretion system protein VirB11
MAELNQMALERKLKMLETAFGETVMHYLYDEKTIEIMLNPDGRLHYERVGEGKVATDIYFSSAQSENIIKLVASFKEGVANADNPEVAAELPFEGARFEGWLPPVVDQACFSIRRRAVAVFTLDQYVEQKAITLNQKQLLQKAIADRKNIIVVGGTGSGKTTFCNALLDQLNGNYKSMLMMS